MANRPKEIDFDAEYEALLSKLRLSIGQVSTHA